MFVIFDDILSEVSTFNFVGGLFSLSYLFIVDFVKDGPSRSMRMSGVMRIMRSIHGWDDFLLQDSRVILVDGFSNLLWGQALLNRRVYWDIRVIVYIYINDNLVVSFLHRDQEH